MKRHLITISGVLAAIGIFALCYFFQPTVIAIVLTYIIATEVIKLGGNR